MSTCTRNCNLLQCLGTNCLETDLVLYSIYGFGHVKNWDFAILMIQVFEMELSNFCNGDGGLLARRSLALAHMILLLCVFQALDDVLRLFGISEKIMDRC